MNGRDMKPQDNPTQDLLDHYEAMMAALDVLKERIKEVHPLPADYNDRKDFMVAMYGHREWLDTCQKLYYEFRDVINHIKLKGDLPRSHMP